MTAPHTARTPSILLLHGVGSSATTWWRAAEDLTELGWRVSTRDLLGHGGRAGGPAAPDWLGTLAADVATTTGDEGFDVVLGHSLGALVALTLAAARPDKAQAVILEDPPALGGSFTVGEVAAELEDDVQRISADADAVELQLSAANPRWAHRDVTALVDNRRRLDLSAVTEVLRRSSWDLAALVEGCPRPVGLVAAVGPGSALVEPVRSPLLAALPADHVRLVPGGHGIHRDRPALWLRAVTALAATLLEGGHTEPERGRPPRSTTGGR